MEQTTLSKKQEIGKWTAALRALIAEVEEWSAQLGWATSRQAKSIRERSLGAYQVEDLIIKTPSGVLVLDVKARNVADADGRVDLYILHNLNRMLLIRKENRWTLKTDTGVRWPKPWNRTTFSELPELVASAA
jgi:hypothetical protein